MAIFNVSELHEMVDAVGRASGGDEIVIATGTCETGPDSVQ